MKNDTSGHKSCTFFMADSNSRVSIFSGSHTAMIPEICVKWPLKASKMILNQGQFTFKKKIDSSSSAALSCQYAGPGGGRRRKKTETAAAEAAENRKRFFLS